MRKTLLSLLLAAGVLAATAVPALAAGPPATPAATVTRPTGDPTSQGTVVPPSGIVSVDVEADHADGHDDAADVTVP